MTWSFERKNSRGRHYMCLVQKVRTERGPRNVKQIYLGTADALFEKLQGPPSTPIVDRKPCGLTVDPPNA
jgi:hypothetical protein